MIDYTARYGISPRFRESASVCRQLPTTVCGTLAISNWWTVQSDGHGREIQYSMPGTEVQARVACQHLCEQQSAAGVCAFKNYLGRLSCWFSNGGTMIDYTARYGISPNFRESASVCT
jgi:hypothetical protein